MNWDCSLIMRSSVDQRNSADSKVPKRKPENGAYIIPNVFQNKSMKLRKQEQERSKDVKKKVSLKSKNSSKNKTAQSGLHVKTQYERDSESKQNTSPGLSSGFHRDSKMYQRPETEPFYGSKNEFQNLPTFGSFKQIDTYYPQRIEPVSFRALNSASSSNISHAHYNMIQPQHPVASFCPISTTRLYSPDYSSKILTILPNDKNKPKTYVRVSHLAMPQQVKTREDQKISFKFFGNTNKSEKKQGIEQKENTLNQNNEVNAMTEKNSVIKDSRISYKNILQETKNSENRKSGHRKKKIEDFLKEKAEIRSVRDSDDLSEQCSQVIITYQDIIKQNGQFHLDT